MTLTQELREQLLNGDPQIMRKVIDQWLTEALTEALKADDDLIDEYIIYGSIAFTEKYGADEARRIAEYLR